MRIEQIGEDGGMRRGTTVGVLLLAVFMTGLNSCRSRQISSDTETPEPIVQFSLRSDPDSPFASSGIIISDEDDDIRIPTPDAENSVMNLMERARHRHTIEPYPEETVQLYSEWSGISAEELTYLNNRELPTYGKPYSLSLTYVEMAEFQKKRERYWVDRTRANTENHHVSITEYTVKRGDTLAQIASRHQIDLWLLVRYNRANDPRRLQPGQVLTIPVLTERQMEESRGRVEAEPLTQEEPREGNLHRIIVRPRERVVLYARWAGVEVEDIQAANPGANLHVIRVGQRLLLPCSPAQFLEFEKQREEFHQ